MNERALLQRVCDAYRHILGENLVGVYLHGSMAMGCFTWATGDIDFLVVVDAPLARTEKEALVRVLLDMDADAPPKGFEMSVVLRRDCRPFLHPMPFELHFSNAHKTRAAEDLSAYCRDMHGTDPDLAAHVTVLQTRGERLYGPESGDVFSPVPRAAYVDSLMYDIASAGEDIADNPVYVTLNLCRVLANLCAAEKVPITILCPADDDGQQRPAFNGLIAAQLGARIVPCLKTGVAETVDRVLEDIRRQGDIPYYIYGDRTGQGNRAVPVRAYASCAELARQARGFDQIVLALGTGMTQAGILCALQDVPDAPGVLGISIARDEAGARMHITGYLRDYLGAEPDPNRIHVCDRFRNGYGQYDEAVQETIRMAMLRWGLPLDGTYTGKAFHGMMTLAREEGWHDQKILFVHTGGTPLFFDHLR